MDWVNNIFITLEVVKELLSIGILIMVGIVGFEVIKSARKCSKEINLMSKRLEILMNIPVKQAREILKGKKSEQNSNE